VSSDKGLTFFVERSRNWELGSRTEVRAGTWNPVTASFLTLLSINPALPFYN
jgi:hypothetical protein